MNIVDLIKKYDGKAVVNSVSFEIPKGKVLSMIGPNGARKSIPAWGGNNSLQ